jgi:hypothetical protein
MPTNAYTANLHLLEVHEYIPVAVKLMHAVWELLPYLQANPIKIKICENICKELRLKSETKIMQHTTNSEELISKRTLRTENGTPSAIMYCKCKCNHRV